MTKRREKSAAVQCRPGCAACCIAPSISSSIPGMPQGKPAGMPCAQLTAENRCELFGLPQRPAVCLSLQPHPDMCGENAAEALARLAELERLTRPGAEKGRGNPAPAR
ncbi:YkgJ family cysteine cluster protein [Geoalkalibacter sp.]|uniref:YkgJ family cysteine cluster protein n=1 Tax=Geoalkalibacter sp. TaxID=3041440 RepID=UPI00272E2590|nr:YkgJ family cysteine cluster protein [Geoalkalibacter sp.]